MVSGSFAQKKLSKNSLRIKSLGLSQTPPLFSTAYPLCFATLVNERKIAKNCKKKEEESRR